MDKEDERTLGPWTSDCSGAIYATIDGHEFIIGKMYAAADRDYVVQTCNSVSSLREALAGFLQQQLVIESAVREAYGNDSPSHKAVLAAIFKARAALSATQPSTEVEVRK